MGVGGRVVELYVMPLSVYRSGNFVSPALERAWQIARLYDVEPELEGRRVPEGEPLGGPAAGQERDRLLPEFQRLMLTLPEEGQAPWNEASMVRPRFHEVNRANLYDLRKEARRRLDTRPTLGRLFKTEPYHCQLARANTFLPVYLRASFERGDLVFGSLSVLIRELGAVRWSDGAMEAAEALRRAARDATELRLPLVIADP